MSSSEMLPVTTETHAVVTPTPMHLIQMAMANGAGVDTMERLLSLQERYEANQARAAFHEAMAAFKSEPLLVTKDKENKQYQSRYTTLGNWVDAVTPALTKHGLNITWPMEVSDPKNVKVGCTVRHLLGHSETVWMSAPPDPSGQKNPVQQVKSTVTYLRACTLECVLGLAATHDANLDDDGNGGVALADGIRELNACETIEELAVVFARLFRAAQTLKNVTILKSLQAAKDTRKQELTDANR